MFSLLGERGGEAINSSAKMAETIVERPSGEVGRMPDSFGIRHVVRQLSLESLVPGTPSHRPRRCLQLHPLLQLSDVTAVPRRPDTNRRGPRPGQTTLHLVGQLRHGLLMLLPPALRRLDRGGQSRCWIARGRRERGDLRRPPLVLSSGPQSQHLLVDQPCRRPGFCCTTAHPCLDLIYRVIGKSSCLNAPQPFAILLPGLFGHHLQLLPGYALHSRLPVNWCVTFDDPNDRFQVRSDLLPRNVT
mmetsp:Transcript_47231/g.102839  ORF Transcript_47231/g.102839 Transcript_47231/m.102839 type:complete len:245 (+) Transcript_47231:648-1382(+)